MKKHIIETTAVKKVVLTIAILGTTMMALSSSAGLISAYIDFGNGTAVTSPDTNGSYWNEIRSFSDNIATIASLNSIENSSTGWGLEVDLFPDQSANHWPAVTTGNWNGTVAPAPYNITGAWQDALASRVPGTIIKISLTGLESSKEYSIDLWGAYENINGSWIDGEVRITDGTVVEGGTSFTLEHDTLLTLSMSPTAGGAITMEYESSRVSSDVSDYALLNLMSVTQIPEPSSLMLLGLAALGLFRRRCRK